MLGLVSANRVYPHHMIATSRAKLQPLGISASRQIDRIVEPAFIRKLTASCYANSEGRPSIDPVASRIPRICMSFSCVFRDKMSRPRLRPKFGAEAAEGSVEGDSADGARSSLD